MVLNDIIEQAAGREMVEEHGGELMSIKNHCKLSHFFTNSKTHHRNLLL